MLIARPKFQFPKYPRLQRKIYPQVNKNKISVNQWHHFCKLDEDEDFDFGDVAGFSRWVLGGGAVFMKSIFFLILD